MTIDDYASAVLAGQPTPPRRIDRLTLAGLSIREAIMRVLPLVMLVAAAWLAYAGISYGERPRGPDGLTTAVLTAAGATVISLVRGVVTYRQVRRTLETAYRIEAHAWLSARRARAARHRDEPPSPPIGRRDLPR